jgi:hypothetical protein
MTVSGESPEHPAPGDRRPLPARHGGAVRRRGARTGAALMLLVAAGAAVLFRGALFSGESFSERDLTAYYRPAKSLIAPLARSTGGLPLWNPLFASGQPFAANPEHQIFHPLTALFLLLPFEWAFRLQVLVPVLVAAPSMFACLRAMRRSRGAALLGGLGWGFGGYLLSVTNLLPILFGAAVLPLALAAAVTVVRTGSLRSVAALAASVGLLALGGEPATLLSALFLAGVAALEALPRRNSAAARRGLSRALGGVVLGIFLGAAALLPGLALLGRTVRSEGVPEAASSSWSMPASRLVELFVPPPSFRTAVPGTRYADRVQPYLYSVYPGLLMTLLAFVAWFRRPARIHLWAAAAVAGVAVASGSHLPFWALLRRLPLLSALRYPEKFLLVTLSSIVVVAAAGYDLALARGRFPRRMSGLLPGLVAAGVLVLVALGSGGEATGFPAVLLARQLLLLAALAGTLFLARGGRRRFAAFLLPPLLLADLVSAGGWLVPTRPVRLLSTPPPVIAELLERPLEGPVFHLAAVSTRRQIAIPAIATPPMPAEWGVAMTLETDVDMTELLWSRRAKRAFAAAVNRHPDLLPVLLARRGVAATIRFRSGVRQTPLGPVWPRELANPVEVVRPSEPPRFLFCAESVLSVAGEAGWVDAVSRLGEKADRTICLEEEVAARAPGVPGPGFVRLRSRSPDRIGFDVDAAGPQPAVVAVNQTWDTGWTARVDGAPTPVLRADLALSAVVVPPGRHRVEMVYDDPAVRRGIVVSLLAAAACLCLLLLPRTGRGFDATER